MSTAYYSLNELRGLPGLPVAERALRELAKLWASRPRQGRGGGLEYSSESLPPITLAAIEQRAAVAQIPFDLQAEYGHPNPDIRPEATRADSKVWYLNALDKFRTAHQLTITAAREYFTLAVRLGLVKIPAAVSGVIRKISITTLRRWEQVMKIMGLDKLNGLWKGRKSLLDLEEIREQVKGLLIYSCKKIEAELRVRFKDKKIPSTRAIRNFKKKFTAQYPREVLRTIKGDDAYRNSYGRGKEGSLSEGITMPNQQWMMDGTKANTFVLADGSRYWILATIDVFSRRVVTSFHKENNATSVTNGVFRNALATMGIPEVVKIDNGSEYVNSHFQTACNSLEIDVHLCRPGNPMEKGNIERFFGTMTQDFERGLPGYVGSNVIDRKAFGTILPTLTPVQFAEMLEQYTTYYNERRVHSSIGCTPMEKWAEGVQKGAEIRTIKDPHILDLLLLEAVKGRTRKVGAEGIQVGGHWYASESPVYEEYKGRTILCKYNPADMGRIYCFTPKGEYLFIAYCPELTGTTRAQLVAKIKANRKTAQKFKQTALTYYNTVDAEKGERLTAFQNEQPANLPVIEQAKRLAQEIAAIEMTHPYPSEEGIKTYLEPTQDVIALDAAPIDPLDRYRWYRSRIHTGKTTTASVLDLLKSIESHKQNWSVMIEADLRWVTPAELAESRPVEYSWELAKAATMLKPKHESTPWRAYQFCLSLDSPTLAQRQFMRDFESHPVNQSIVPILQQHKIYRGDLLNIALADNPNATPDNWRFEAGYFQRFYQFPERDLLHFVSGQEPIKNPDYDWANHQAIIQRRKEAS